MPSKRPTPIVLQKEYSANYCPDKDRDYDLTLIQSNQSQVQYADAATSGNYWIMMILFQRIWIEERVGDLINGAGFVF